MTNTITRNEILDSIDQIGSIAMESSLDVLFSMAETFDKSVMIMENYSGDELDMFSIFQEAEEATQDSPEEQNSAVQQGDPSSQTTADAKKKEDSVIMKILKFIPNMLAKIWQFIKDAWNGVIVPKAETVTTTVSDKTASIFDKIAGKDEEWLKKYGPALGLGAGAITLLGGVLTFLNRDKIAAWLTEWHTSIKALFMRMSVTPKLAFQNGSIVTNIKFSGLRNTIKSYSEVSRKIAAATTKLAQSGYTAAEGKKVLNEIIRDYESYKNAAEQDPFIVDDTPYADAVRSNQDIVSELFFLVDHFKKVEVPPVSAVNVDSNSEVMADPEIQQKVSLLNKIATSIGKFLTGTGKFVKNAYDWVIGLSNKIKEVENEIDKGNDSDETPTGTEETSEYEAVSGDTAPEWVDGKFYSKGEDGTYTAVSAKPDDWDTSYTNYFTKKTAAVENGVDDEPDDGTEPELNRGSNYSAKQAEKILDKYGFPGATINPDTHEITFTTPSGNTTNTKQVDLRNTGKGNLTLKWSDDKNSWVLESAEDSTEDELVSDYVSNWYSR